MKEYRQNISAHELKRKFKTLTQLEGETAADWGGVPRNRIASPVWAQRLFVSRGAECPSNGDSHLFSHPCTHRLSMDHSLVREESFYYALCSNCGSPAARRKTDFKDDSIVEIGVQLPPPFAVWKALRLRGTKPLHWLSIWLPEGSLLMMPHTDGGETSNRDFNHRPMKIFYFYFIVLNHYI